MSKILVTKPGTNEGHYIDSEVIDPAYAEWTLALEAEDAALALALRKDELRAQVISRLAEAFLAGFTPTTGPLKGHTLQLRGADDRANWQDSRRKYKETVDAGAGALPGATFRTAANKLVGCTFAQGLAALDEMDAWGWRLMFRSWVLKDDIEKAPSIVAADAIKIDEGWA